MDKQTEIKKLAVFLADNKIQKSNFAREIGVHKTQISYWLKHDYYIMYNVGTGNCALFKMMRRFDFNVLHRARNSF